MVARHGYALAAGLGDGQASGGLKLRFIFNPRSGRNARKPRLLQLTRDFIAARQLDAELVATEHPGHATDLARQAVTDGCDVVVAIGGDGTMNEVASALVHTPATLGLIACGSGNGLARHLGIYGPLQHMFATLLTGRPRVIDSGLIDARPFFITAGLGFEAEIADQFARLHRRGFFRYLSLSASCFRRFQPPDCVIHTSERTLRTPLFTLAVANCAQYGNNAYIAPGARADDGLLDLIVVPPVGVWGVLPLAAQLFTRRLDRNPRVTRLREAQFVLEREQRSLIHTDGEPHQAGPRLIVTVRPASLRVLVPSINY